MGKCGVGQPLKWTGLILTNTPSGRYGATISARNNVLYMFGGQRDPGGRNLWKYLDDMWFFSMDSMEWKERKYWKWKKTGSPRGREGHNSFFLPAPRPTTKTPITYDKLFIWAGHSAWNKWYYNRQSKDLSTQQDYRNDMWYYKFPKVQNENINSTACSDCLDSFGDLRECTVGASEADLEGEV